MAQRHIDTDSTDKDPKHFIFSRLELSIGMTGVMTMMSTVLLMLLIQKIVNAFNKTTLPDKRKTPEVILIQTRSIQTTTTYAEIVQEKLDLEDRVYQNKLDSAAYLKSFQRKVIDLEAQLKRVQKQKLCACMGGAKRNCALCARCEHHVEHEVSIACQVCRDSTFPPPQH